MQPLLGGMAHLRGKSSSGCMLLLRRALAARHGVPFGAQSHLSTPEALARALTVAPQQLCAMPARWAHSEAAVYQDIGRRGKHAEDLEPGHSVPVEGPFRMYQDRRASGLYRQDARQKLTAAMLQRLYDDLRAAFPRPKRPSGLTLVDNVAVSQPKASWWSALGKALSSDSTAEDSAPEAQPARGLYMYGGVGVGKTMLMDLFVESAPREFKVQRNAAACLLLLVCQLPSKIPPQPFLSTHCVPLL